MVNKDQTPVLLEFDLFGALSGATFNGDRNLMTYATTTFDASGLYDRSARTAPRARPAPWARYFSKTLDIIIFFVGFYIVVGVLGLVSPESDAWVWMYWPGLLLFPFFESVSQFLFGNTLGKKLLGMRVLDRSGKAASFAALLQRNYRCYVHGLALGIPIALTVTNILGFRGYMRNGISAWDRDADTVCANQGAAIWRTLAIGAAPFWLPLVLIFIISAVSSSNTERDLSVVAEAIGRPISHDTTSHLNGQIHEAVLAHLASAQRELPVMIDDTLTIDSVALDGRAIRYRYSVNQYTLDTLAWEIDALTLNCTPGIVRGWINADYAIEHVFVSIFTGETSQFVVDQDFCEMLDEELD